VEQTDETGQLRFEEMTWDTRTSRITASKLYGASNR
jgi:hypothetical protein